MAEKFPFTGLITFEQSPSKITRAILFSLAQVTSSRKAADSTCSGSVVNFVNPVAPVQAPTLFGAISHIPDGEELLINEASKLIFNID